MQNKTSTVVVLGTGGTIAGTAASSSDNIGYTSARIGVAQLVADVPALAAVPLETEQVAQVDSKDMSFAIWCRLAERIAHHLGRDEVAGIVVTHGTDTLEETAYFLHRVLAPGKPVVLTAAMRPATALLRDGPQNLLDAVRVAQSAGAQGVVAVLAGVVHSAVDVCKVHTYSLDPFSSGDAGPLARVEEGALRQHRPWPVGSAISLAKLRGDMAAWPKVEVVMNYAGANGDTVRALCALGVQGIVAACTGNGTLHHDLEAALLKAQSAGVRVLRSSRGLGGVVLAKAGDALPSAGALTPAKARIELILQLMGSAPS